MCSSDLGDPRFAERNCAGYLTLPGGSRPYFYHLPTVSAEMLLADEEHRDVVALRDLSDIERAWESAPTTTCVPLMIAVGEQDFAYHWDNERDFAAAQRSYYPLAQSIETFVAPGTGHNLNLHGRGPAATQAMLDWVLRIGG